MRPWPRCLRLLGSCTTATTHREPLNPISRDEGGTALCYAREAANNDLSPSAQASHTVHVGVALLHPLLALSPERRWRGAAVHLFSCTSLSSLPTILRLDPSTLTPPHHPSRSTSFAARCPPLLPPYGSAQRPSAGAAAWQWRGCRCPVVHLLRPLLLVDGPRTSRVLHVHARSSLVRLFASLQHQARRHPWPHSDVPPLRPCCVLLLP